MQRRSVRWLPSVLRLQVDVAAARMTSCRTHRKLYAQDILVDLMALQIKFAVTKVITFITNNAIQWMKNITH